MTHGDSVTKKRTFIGSLLAASAFLVASAALNSAPAQARPCKNADVAPTAAEQVVPAQRAVRCLVNNERRKRGLRGLRVNRRLAASSLWQARDMVDYAYFDHQRDDGPQFADRILRFGYARGAHGHSLGENLAWSTSEGATPREMVRMWMRSPGHRANILRRVFREQAVAVLTADGDQIGGDFADAGPLTIYVNQFGTRH